MRSCERFSDLVAAEPHGEDSVTYRELRGLCLQRARELDSLGLEPGDRLALIGETCLDWSVTDWAAQTLGLVTVPIYPTLPEDQANYIVLDSGARAAIALEEGLVSKVDGVEGCEARALGSLKPSAMTDAQWLNRCGGVKRDEIATLIYTSGTTGAPKGAMLDHNAFLSLCEGVVGTLPITCDDKFLAFLPMSHVFARFGDHALSLSAGATTAYAKSTATLSSDMLRSKPTIMLVVPRFLQSVRGRVLDNIAKQSGFKQFMFRLARDQGVKRASGGFAPLFPLTDAMVGKKIREKTGGRIRFFVSGGAALDPEATRFFQAFGLNVLQGYGLTETCAATCVNVPEDNRPETVGPPIPPNEIRIAEDGEILIRGATVMKGYHNLPEDTAQAIDADGWFHSGDIGEFVDGRLKITDRKKDLIVLENGKNVAPQHIENKLKQSEFINEAVLFGDGMEYVCGLIVPETERVRKELGLAEDAALQSSEDARALIKREVLAVNKTLADFERVKRHELVATEFSIESGELTPSLKVKRRVVREKYADLLDSMKRK